MKRENSRRSRHAILFLAGLLGCAAATIVPASSQTLLEVLAGTKFCRTLKDDAQRLKCFDQLFVEKPNEQGRPKQIEADVAWNVEQSKSPVDDSPQFTAHLVSGSDSEAAILILRCKENKTEAYFGRKFVYLGSGDRVKVIMRIGDGKPIETMWSPSTDGRAVFAPSAIQFIGALPDNTKLFLRAVGYRGQFADGEFNLGNVSDIREKIAKACNWSADKARGQK